MADSEVKIRVVADAKGVAPALVSTKTAFTSLSEALAKTQQNTESMKRSTAALPAPLSTAAAAAATLTTKIRSFDTALRSATPGLESIQQRGGEIASGFGVAAASFGAVAVGLLGLGGYAVKTAGEFELLRGKLNALAKDSVKGGELFDLAVTKAAQTPFDVQGVVKATISLETFGNDAVKHLDNVLALGAAFGDLDNATLAYSKAISGSLEGFESLRNTYGLSTAKLKQFGGAVDEQGQVMVRTKEQIQQNARAVEAYTKIQFAGAIEAQAKTLIGAFSNLKDSVQTLAASFGAILVPAVTFVARTLSAALNGLKEMDQGFKVLAVGAGLVVTGLAGLAAAGLSAIAGLGLLGAAVASIGLGFGAVSTGLASLTVQFPVAAVAATAFGNAMLLNAARMATFTAAALTTPLALGSVGAAFGLAGTAAVAFGNAVLFGVGAASTALARLAALALANPVTATFLAVGAAMSIVTIKAREAEQANIALDKVLKSQSQSLQLATVGFRDLANKIEKATGAQLNYSSNAAATTTNSFALAAALGAMTAGEAAAEFTKLGLSAKQVNELLADTSKQANAAKKKLDELTILQGAVKAAQDSITGSVRTDLLTPKQAALFKEMGGDVNLLATAVNGASIEFNKLDSAAKNLGLISDKITPIAKAMEEVSKQATSLDTYLKFAGREDDLKRLAGTVKLIGTTLKSATTEYEKFYGAGTASTDALTDALIGAGAEQKAAIEDILALREQETKFNDLITKQKEAEAKKAREAVRAEIDAKNEVLAEDRAGLQARIANIDEGLAKVAAGTDEEKALHRDKRDAIAKGEKLTVDELAKSLKAREDAVAASIANETRYRGSSAASIATATREGVRAVEAWGAANVEALASSPQLMGAYRAALASANAELAKAKDLKVEESFQKLSAALDEAIDKAATAPEKLEAVRDAISALTAEESLATTSSNRATIQAQINGLKSQELQIVNEMKAAEEALAGEVAALRVAAIQNEIRLLEARKAAGEGVDGALTLKKGELNKARVEAIDKEAADAIKGGENEELVLERARLKKQQIEADTTLDAYNEKQQRLKDTKKAADDEVGVEVDKRRRIKQAATTSTSGPTGPGATVDRQTGTFGGTSPFGQSANSSAPVSGLGNFFDNFGVNNRTIDRGATGSTFSAASFQDDATFKANLPDTTGTGIYPTPNGRPIFTDDASRIQANIDRQAATLAKQKAESGAVGPGTDPANRPINIGADGQPLSGGTTSPQTTVNDSRTVVINMQGSGSLTPNPGNSKAIKDAVDAETKYHAFYNGSGGAT
jgi:hypothetical protein